MTDNMTQIRDGVATLMMDRFLAGMTPLEALTGITLAVAAMYRSLDVPTDDAIRMFADLLRSQDGSMDRRDVN